MLRISRGSDGVDGALVVGYVEVDALGSVLGHLDGAEELLDFSLDAGRVDVAHHDDALLVGTVPLVVVVAEHLRVEVVDHLHGADGQTVAVAVVGVDGGEQLFDDAHLAHVGAAPFLVDYAALLVDFLGVEQQVVGPVVEDEQAAVLHALACGGHVGDVVDGLVDGGVGVEVLAEFHTY